MLLEAVSNLEIWEQPIVQFTSATQRSLMNGVREYKRG